MTAERGVQQKMDSSNWLGFWSKGEFGAGRLGFQDKWSGGLEEML